MPSPIPTRTARAALAGLALAAAAPAFAQDDSIWESFPLPKSTWSLFSGVTFTDNASLSQNGKSDEIFRLGGTGAFFKDEGRLYANVRGAAWFEDYLSGSYKSKFLGSMAGALRYQIIPERLSWTLAETYGQTVANTLAPASRANQVNASFFSTGPDLTLPFGVLSGFRAGARYERNNYGGGQLNEERERGNVSLFHRFAPTTEGSLNVALTRTTFQNGTVLGADGRQADRYDIREAFGRLGTRRARYALSLDAGVSEVEQLGTKQRSPLLRANLYRRLTPSISLNLGAGQEYRNSGDILRESISGVRIVHNQVVYIPPGIDPTYVYNVIGDLNNRSQPIKYQFVRGSLDFVRPRTTFTLSGSSGRERFQFSGQSLDRDVWDAGIALSRRLRPNITATLTASYFHRNFLQLAGTDETKSAGIHFTWRVSSMVSVAGGYRHDDHQSQLGLYQYKANALFVNVSYGRGGGMGGGAGGGLFGLAPGAAPMQPAPGVATPVR
jgi:hypothetical protein